MAKNALITGAGSGIGRAIAAALTERGYRLILVDRDAARLQDVSDTLEPALAIDLDISDTDRVDTLPAALPDDLREIDTLINAAGHDPGGTTRFDLGSADDWQSAIETNLLGTMRLTRAVLPSMVQRNSGDIVNIGSVAGIRIVPDMTAYNVSKAAIHAFSNQLRADLRDTAIRVIEVMPGLTKTDLIRKRYGGDEQRAAEYYARFKMALEPADVAECVINALEAPTSVVIAQTLVLPNNRW